MLCPTCKKEIISLPCPLCADDQKLEKITDAFVKSLIQNPFEDPHKYVELAERLAVLVNEEINAHYDHEHQRDLMMAWPKSVTQ